MLVPPTLDRTPSNHARYMTAGIRCFERNFEGFETKPPVKLVVFDCDETLTLSTFMPKNKELRLQVGWIEWAEFIANVNFDSPFVAGDSKRIEKMAECFTNLKVGENGEERSLAILTRNESGATACLNLLMMAGLDVHFDAVWSMQAHPNFGTTNACYKKGSTWEKFTSPVGTCYDHKADVLIDVAKNPRAWFPQLTADGKGADGENLKQLLEMRPESIVLVDDVRTNFQSMNPVSQAKVFRYCKVARFDSEYREMGMVTNMGGIGARNLDDYTMLENFVNSPWLFKEANGLKCAERPFDDAELRPPVNLVVFDFDETLTIYTWMPEASAYKSQIGYEGKGKEKAHLVEYNFDSPYSEVDRVKKLKEVLARLLQDPTAGTKRSLAVLTKNEDGAVAVLNLLLMANLAEYFSVIWALGADEGNPNGVYRDGTEWKVFPLPLGNVEEEAYKAVVLNQVAVNPAAWFPQLPSSSPDWAHMKDLKLHNIALVDDERSSFQKKLQDDEEDENQVLRYCKVAHYDDTFRDQGLLVHMGGIGAKNEKDYDKLIKFVETPWQSRMSDKAVEAASSFFFSRNDPVCDPGVELERRTTSEDEDSLRCSGRTRRTLTETDISPAKDSQGKSLAASF